MAFKLTKDESARRDKILGELQTERSKLEDAISVYNANVEDLKNPVVAALEQYNAVVEEARGFAEDVANQAEQDYDDKSDKWQEGDKGQAASGWKDEWENADFQEFEIEFPDELPSDLPEHAETLENLPGEAEQG
jgi:hypothetical protein